MPRTTMTRTMITNPTKAKKTKKIQTSIQAAMAVIPSTFGEFVVTMLKMLISTWRRRIVTNITILNKLGTKSVVKIFLKYHQKCNQYITKNIIRILPTILSEYYQKY